MEEFYSQYGYEPDEQPLHIQEYSTTNIVKHNVNIWLETLFNIKKENYLPTDTCIVY